MPKMIGFFGSCPADICMYTAYALQNAGKRVCVVDNSQDGILFGCIPTPDQRFTTVTFHNVDFMRWEPLVQWHELDYEFVLVQLGNRPQELCLAVCSERILVVDCERKHLDFYEQYMRDSCLPAAVLLRGFYPQRTTVKKIKAYFEQDNTLIDRWLLLPLDAEDEAYRIKMQYGLLDQFTHISAGMEHVLVQLLRMLEIHDKRRVQRAVKDAKQGKMTDMAVSERRRDGCGHPVCSVQRSV